MMPTVVSFGPAILFVTALAMLVRYYWLAMANSEAAAHRSFLAWSARGLAIPLVLWALLAGGALPGMPPFTPRFLVVKAAGGAGWLGVFLGDASAGWVVLTTVWAAFSLLWLAVVLISQAGNRSEFRVLIGIWTLLALPVILSILYWAGVSGLGLALLVWVVPVIHFIRPLTTGEALPPSYARAIAKLKFGRYREAEQEVITELERCTEDFDGWMLLAEMYATQFNDLAGADRTVRELCGQPNVNETQISLALDRLADWHLKLGQDPVAARRALEEISRRLPGSLFDRGARQRVATLPRNREDLLERQQTRPIRLPALGDDLDDAGPAARPSLSPAEAKRQAERCVEKLRENPDDIEARERLAQLMAGSMGKVDLALEQLGLLLGIPGMAEAKRAEWLAQTAAWQLKLKADPAAARATLQRLIQELPQTPQAFAARRRLDLMEMDEHLARLRAAQIPRDDGAR